MQSWRAGWRRVLHRGGVIRQLARSWHRRDARHASIADESALAHVRAQVLRRPADVARLAAQGLA
jgi:hypothetical protein